MLRLKGAHQRSEFQAAQSLVGQALLAWPGQTALVAVVSPHSAVSVLCVTACRWDVQFIDTDGCANGWTGRC